METSPQFPKVLKNYGQIWKNLYCNDLLWKIVTKVDKVFATVVMVFLKRISEILKLFVLPYQLHQWLGQRQCKKIWKMQLWREIRPGKLYSENISYQIQVWNLAAFLYLQRSAKSKCLKCLFWSCLQLVLWSKLRRSQHGKWKDLESFSNH